MKTVFYLFAADEAALKAQLDAYATCLEELDGRFERLRLEVDSEAKGREGPAHGRADGNPWRLRDRDGVVHQRVPPGAGAAYVGDADEVRDCLEKTGLAEAPFVGLDMGVAPAAGDGVAQWPHWCPGGAYATRDRAHRLIGADRLAAAGLDGGGVNVVVVDQGVSAAYVEDALGGRFGGGLAWFGSGEPGAPTRRWTKAPELHGDMVARNVVALAPAATIYDFPLIPDRIDRPYAFSLLAAFGYFALDALLLRPPAPWVVVSPWAVFDRLREPVPGNYTERRNNPLNLVVADMAARHDMVFPAGNSGQFCPTRRSGPYDRGPGRSILGANALEEVLCVGAVRADALWVGASSQGPGPSSLTAVGTGRNEKPDVTAPSWFRDPLDAGLVDTGTSAASAVAAGAGAALRTSGAGTTVAPATLKAALRDGARACWHVGWNGRAGAGVIDLAAAMAPLRGVGAPSACESVPEPEPAPHPNPVAGAPAVSPRTRLRAFWSRLFARRGWQQGGA